MTTTDAPTADGIGRTSSAIIDCDLHNQMTSIRDLYPYLDPRWQSHIETFGIHKVSGADYPRFMPPRQDARPPSGGAPGTDAAFMCEHHFDRYNIAFGTIIPLRTTARSVHLELDAALARATNDWLIDRWLDVDPRLLGSITVPTEDPVRAAEEIHRCAADSRFVQVLFVGRSREPLGKAHYWPIYEAATHHNLPIANHSFHTAGNMLTGCGWPSYYVEDHIGVAQAIQASVTSLIIEGVFERFPTLRFLAVEHTMGWYPSLMWRLDRAWRLFKDEVPHLTMAPSEYLQQHVYVATQPIPEPPQPRFLNQLIESGGGMVDRILFSSDYPHWDSDSPALAIPRSLPPDIRRKILYDNAAQLYGLPTDGA